MIRKSAHKDQDNPPGQIVNRPTHFEKPLEMSIEEYKDVTDCFYYCVTSCTCVDHCRNQEKK